MRMKMERDTAWAAEWRMGERSMGSIYHLPEPALPASFYREGNGILGEVTWQKSQTGEWQSWDLNRLLDSRTWVLNHDIILP